MKMFMRLSTFTAASITLAAATLIATPAAGAASAAPVASMDAALACQAKVVDAASKSAGGAVFLTFDRVPDVNGANVSGNAMDRSVDKSDRALTYSCSGAKATFAYRDGRKPVVMKGSFPSGAVRNCQSAAKATFDAASLSASDSATEYVLGLSGGSVRQCTMDRQRVVTVK